MLIDNLSIVLPLCPTQSPTVKAGSFSKMIKQAMKSVKMVPLFTTKMKRAK